MPEPDSPALTFSSGQRWRVAFHSALGLLAFLALAVMANYIAAGHFLRYNWQRNSAVRLSPQTLRVLEPLTNDISFTLFFDPHDQNQDLYSMASGLLNEYHNANPRHIRVHTLDYTRFDGEARSFLETNKISSLKEKDFVLAAWNGHTRIFFARDLADYDFTDLLSGRSKYVRRNAFRGEPLFTGAIVWLTDPRPRRAYFVFGHGEHDPGDPSGAESGVKLGDTGYSKLAGLLKDEINCDWDRLSLLGTNPIPADCQLLIIAGPRSAYFEPGEISKIDAYLKQGGRLLALLNHDAGLDPILATWGLALGPTNLVEHDPNYRVSDLEMLVASMSPDSPITRPLASEKLSILMILPHALLQLGNTQTPGAPVVKLLAFTSDHATAGSQPGRFPLIATVEQGVIQGVNVPHGGTRLVVAGDSYFLDDQLINTRDANHYFAGLALNWLLETPDILIQDLGSRPIREYRIVLTDAQSRTLRLVFLAAMPGVVLFLGGLVWLRRRS